MRAYWKMRIVVVCCTLIYLVVGEDCDTAPCYDAKTGTYGDGSDGEDGIELDNEQRIESLRKPAAIPPSLIKVPSNLKKFSVASSNVGASPSGVPEMTVAELTVWVTALVADLQYLPKKFYPGQVFAFGPRAFTVLLGQGDMDGVLTVGELEQGRVAAIPQKRYASNIFAFDEGCRSTKRGTEYAGTRATTIGGYTCQSWSSQSPHSHQYTDPSSFPDETLEAASNYCRNPDNKRWRPWCYTTDPEKVFEICYIPTCIENKNHQNLLTFQNNVKRWLTRDSYEGPHNVCYIRSVSDLSCLTDDNVKIAVWVQSDEMASPEADDTMLEWVKSGGALLHAVTPKQWKDEHGQPFSSIPFFNVLMDAGIGYTAKSAKVVNSKYTPSITQQSMERYHSLNAYYSHEKINTIDGFTSSFYITSVSDIIKQGNNVPYGEEYKKRLASTLAPLATQLEPKVVWPYGNGTAIFSSKENTAMLRFYTSISYLGLWRDKAPYVHNFPGDVADVETTSTSLEVTSNGIDFWSTGHYVLPGNAVTIEVVSTDDESWNTFTLRVGHHSDQLTRTNLKRFPIIVRHVRLHQTTTRVFTIFGGMVYIVSPNKAAHIKVNVDGVIKAPYFKLGDPQSEQEWTTRRLAPAPWVDLVGEHMSFHLPASSIRDLDDPAPALRIWDSVVLSSVALAGLKEWRQQWLVTDVQIWAGAAHSGYPIMTYIGAMTKPDKKRYLMRTDYLSLHWAIYHEIGHNMQRSWWTLKGGTEVTCNIFTMHQMDVTAKTNPHAPAGAKSWYNNIMKNEKLWRFLETGNYKTLESNPWIPLLSYSQLYTTFGWECYRQVFTQYEEDARTSPSSLPKSNEEEQQQWVTRWSRQVGYDLSPMYLLYAWPLTADTISSLSDLPAFLPQDNVTNLEYAQERIGVIINSYPTVLRDITTKPDCYQPSYFDRLQDRRR